MSKQIAKVDPPRLPYHPSIADDYGVSEVQWRALVDAVFPSAKTTESVMLALAYCKARNLDPFKKPVHIVPVWSSLKKAEVLTVWPGINELRTTAMRTGRYGGCDPCAFGPMIKQEFASDKIKKVVEFPEWAQITVYRMVDGQRVAYPGPKVYWLETYGRMGRTDVPNDMWQRRTRGQLEKCAEAAALRRAFPEEIGGDLIAEEAHAADPVMRDVTPASDEPVKAGTSRLDDLAGAHGEAANHDPDTGEVRDEPPESGPSPYEREAALLPVPQKEGKADWSAWLKQAGAIVRGAPDTQWLLAWQDANRVALAGLEAASGKNYAKLADLIDDRLAQLDDAGGGPDAGQQELV